MLSAQQQAEWWDADMQGCRAVMERKTMETICEKIAKIDEESWKTQELPLSVWIQRGYDRELVEKCGYRRTHPQLREVFAITLHETFHAKRKEEIMKRLLKKYQDATPDGAKSPHPRLCWTCWCSTGALAWIQSSIDVVLGSSIHKSICDSMVRWIHGWIDRLMDRSIDGWMD